MDTTSLWQAITPEAKSFPSLTQHEECDIVIIGAGITGITTALELLHSGKKIIIVEADTVGSGTTGSSTGNLYVPVQPYYQNISKKFNETIVKKIAQARNDAIDYIEKNVQEKTIDCNFTRRPWFIYSDNENKISFLEKEVETIQQTGLNIHFTKELPYSLPFKKAAVMENQARFNPLQYVIKLADYLSKQRCTIFEKTRVTEIEEKKTRCIVHTEKGKITAQHVVIATHTPIGINPIQFLVSPYRSYAVAVRLKNNNYPEGHLWDLNTPHHVLCTHALHSDKPETLIASGSHHKTGQAKDARAHLKELEFFLRENFDVEEVIYQWSAQHYHSSDDLPYIGLSPNKKNTYIATGYFADGLLYGTIAGVMLANFMLETKYPKEDIFKPTRFTPIASAKKAIKENANVFLQYLKDLPMPKVKTFADVKKGEGKVVEINREKLAVSRDQHDQLHIVSAVCTHMKCIVKWNNSEKSWDCPCHGSRFSCEGKILEGPAEIDLPKKNEYKS